MGVKDKVIVKVADGNWAWLGVGVVVAGNGFEYLTGEGSLREFF